MRLFRNSLLLFLAMCFLLAIGPPLAAQSVWVLRSASGDLTAADTSSEVDARFDEGVVFLNVTKITTADGDDEVDFYVQTTYDGGTNWSDLENVHFDNADNGTAAKKILAIGVTENPATLTAQNSTDGTLADDTKLYLPIGSQIRIKTAVTGASAPTYAYSATVLFR